MFKNKNLIKIKGSQVFSFYRYEKNSNGFDDEPIYSKIIDSKYVG